MLILALFLKLGLSVNLGNIDFRTLPYEKLYFAKNDVNLNLGPSLKSLKITAGTYFSLKENNVLVLLKGQINVETKTDFKIYAIKNDRLDLNIFQEKLDKFFGGLLPEEEYFLVQNVATKFLVKNELGKINIAIEKGEVKIKGKNIEEKISSGNQITIDKKNKIQKSRYFSGKAYQVLGLFVLTVSVILLFIYRHTKIGKFILNLLKKFFEIIFELIKKIVYFLLKKMKKEKDK